MMHGLAILTPVSFWLFAAMMVFGALGVVLHRSIVYNALFLLVTFLSIGAVFVMLNAPFIAAAQILVYGVGLTIVLIFGIMLTGDKRFVDLPGHERPNQFWIIPAIFAACFLVGVSSAIIQPDFHLGLARGLFVAKDAAVGLETAGAQAIVADGGMTMLAQQLFTTYLVPFELASILLLIATMGAILLSKRVFPEEEGELPFKGDTDTTLLRSAESVDEAYVAERQPSGVL